MLKTAIFVCNLNQSIQEYNGDYFGVDKGALYLAKKKIKMKVAIGDFDSVSKDEKSLIESYAENIVNLNPIKDVSDSHAAILQAKEMGYKNGILLGSLGRRMDHTYVNLMLLFQEEMELVILDEYNKIYSKDVGNHKIDKEEYTYFSLFAYDDAIVSLSGVKYPLDKYKLNKKNLIGLSNEILKEEATLQILKGKVLVIQSKD